MSEDHLLDSVHDQNFMVGLDSFQLQNEVARLESSIESRDTDEPPPSLEKYHAQIDHCKVQLAQAKGELKTFFESKGSNMDDEAQSYNSVESRYSATHDALKKVDLNKKFPRDIHDSDEIMAELTGGDFQMSTPKLQPSEQPKCKPPSPVKEYSLSDALDFEQLEQELLEENQISSNSAESHTQRQPVEEDTPPQRCQSLESFSKMVGDSDSEGELGHLQSPLEQRLAAAHHRNRARRAVTLSPFVRRTLFEQTRRAVTYNTMNSATLPSETLIENSNENVPREAPGHDSTSSSMPLGATEELSSDENCPPRKAIINKPPPAALQSSKSCSLEESPLRPVRRQSQIETLKTSESSQSERDNIPSVELTHIRHVNPSSPASSSEGSISNGNWEIIHSSGSPSPYKQTVEGAFGRPIEGLAGQPWPSVLPKSESESEVELSSSLEEDSELESSLCNDSQQVVTETPVKGENVHLFQTPLPEADSENSEPSDFGTGTPIGETCYAAPEGDTHNDNEEPQSPANEAASDGGEQSNLSCNLSSNILENSPSKSPSSTGTQQSSTAPIVSTINPICVHSNQADASLRWDKEVMSTPLDNHVKSCVQDLPVQGRQGGHDELMASENRDTSEDFIKLPLKCEILQEAEPESASPSESVIHASTPTAPSTGKGSGEEQDTYSQALPSPHESPIASPPHLAMDSIENDISHSFQTSPAPEYVLPTEGEESLPSHRGPITPTSSNGNGGQEADLESIQALPLDFGPLHDQLTQVRHSLQDSPAQTHLHEVIGMQKVEEKRISDLQDQIATLQNQVALMQRDLSFLAEKGQWQCEHDTQQYYTDPDGLHQEAIVRRMYTARLRAQRTDLQYMNQYKDRVIEQYQLLTSSILFDSSIKAISNEIYDKYEALQVTRKPGYRPLTLQGVACFVLAIVKLRGRMRYKELQQSKLRTTLQHMKVKDTAARLTPYYYTNI